VRDVVEVVEDVVVVAGGVVEAAGDVVVIAREVVELVRDVVIVVEGVVEYQSPKLILTNFQHHLTLIVRVIGKIL
jgi:hypothetical protein